MSFNIPSRIMALNPDIEFRFNTNQFTKSQLSKFHKAATSGVSRNGGVAGALGLMLRSSNGLDGMNVKHDCVQIFNVKDLSIFEPIEAAIVLGKIRMGKNCSFGIYGNKSISLCGSGFETIEEAKKSPYKTFRIYMHGIANLIKSPKLEAMEVNTEKQIVLNEESMSLLSIFC
jgi:hypothetical protein